MTIETRPTPFGMAISREVEDAKKHLASALRLCERARGAIGPAAFIDPALSEREKALGAAQVFLTYAADYANDALASLAPLVKEESAAQQPTAAEQPRTVTARDEQDDE